MQRVKTILRNNGEEGKKAYQDSLRQNDRVATGKTLNSIRFEVKEGAMTSKLIFYAADHIRQLEEGRGKSKSNSGSGFFAQIVEWVQARALPYDPYGVYKSINESGWNTSLPNRTGANGGTAGLITDVDQQIENNVLNDIKQNSKFMILEELKNLNNTTINT